MAEQSPQSPLTRFIEALGAWGEELFRRGFSVAPDSDEEPPLRVSAVDGFAPLECQGVDLSLWLRSRGLSEAADKLDAGVEEVRGWSWAYDEGGLETHAIDDEHGQIYREIDYVVEATQISCQALRELEASLPASVWDGFVDE